ncbi:MAG: tRNA dihydrouridine synthase DusB [Deltaproteobacteria bacterium]|nr:tRNA dihydrouridine synthase DusB [Deltaproteobacteria bacterium]MBU48609.1 tRNA dihydrouridine synthase DusB [Deltaproteobacteria bacterium]|tara:strand:- start:5319 stop:6434 length:1116 start_codon:yes stop_codon:yes gene_type:complete
MKDMTTSASITHMTLTLPEELRTREPLEIGGVVCDPPVILAPMAAVTNPPFRLICREMGAGMVVTEMVSARSLVNEPVKQRWRLDIREDEHPVCVQLFGGDPDEMARAAALVEDVGADMVDINMGCPMKKVVQSGYGAALLKDPGKVERMVKAMTDAVDIPVTVKMRAGWEDTNACDVARAVENGGGAAVTIHGRTRQDMFEGLPDLDIIATLKETVAIPVIGNGDVRDVQSAREMLMKTSCDAVMVARGCMGYPWIFRELAAAFSGRPIPGEPDIEERRRVMFLHLDLYMETYGLRKTMLEIRKHLLWYFKGTPGERELKRRFSSFVDVSSVRGAIEAAIEACLCTDEVVTFPRGLKKHPNRRQAEKKCA